MIGVSFTLWVEDMDAYLLKLDTLMDISKYDWYIDDVELNYYEYRAGRYSSSEFREALFDLSALSFVRIRRYPVGASIGDIDSLNDYMESDCDLLILKYDGGFHEVYAKDKDIIRKTLELADERFKNPDFIEDGDRSCMHF